LTEAPREDAAVGEEVFLLWQPIWDKETAETITTIRAKRFDRRHFYLIFPPEDGTSRFLAIPKCISEDPT
jgi:hypothetical protein